MKKGRATKEAYKGDTEIDMYNMGQLNMDAYIHVCIYSCIFICMYVCILLYEHVYGAQNNHFVRYGFGDSDMLCGNLKPLNHAFWVETLICSNSRKALKFFLDLTPLVEHRASK